MNVTLFALGILAGIVNAIRVVEDILEPPTPPTTTTTPTPPATTTP
jgi:hypothetical protein